MVTTVPVLITYRKPGTQPPLYVAGTFSDPQWLPSEMDYTTEQDTGEHTFKKEIQAKPEEQIQYKFRLGPGDWWVLNEDAPTITDDAGNRNNLIDAPAAPESKPANYKELNGDIDPLADQRSSTPMAVVTATTAEVADTAATLDNDGEVFGDIKCAATPDDAVQEHKTPKQSVQDWKVFLPAPQRSDVIALPSYADNLSPPEEELRRASMADVAEFGPTGDDVHLFRHESCEYRVKYPATEHNHEVVEPIPELPKDDAVDSAHKKSSLEPNAASQSSREDPLADTSSLSAAKTSEPQRRSEASVPVAPMPNQLAHVDTPTPPASDEDDGIYLKSNGRGSNALRNAASSELSVEGAAVERSDTNRREQSEAGTSEAAITIVSDNAQEDRAKSTATDTNGSNSLTKRNTSTSEERPASPSKSLHSIHTKEGTWVGMFVRLVFVDWIGGFFGKIVRLFGGGRKA